MGDQRPSPFTFWSLVPPFLRCNNHSVRTSALRCSPPSERTTLPTTPRAAPGMLSAASSSFSSGLPTTPTRPHGPGSLWPGLGWRRRRRRGSYGGGGLCREVRQRRRGESRVLWSELEGEAGGVRGWAVSARGRGPARVAAWREGPSPARPGREAGAAGGRGGRGGSLGRGGWGWLGSGTQGTPPNPAQPASACPCQALLYHRPRVTAVGAASRARLLRSSESTRMDEIFENQITNRSYWVNNQLLLIIAVSPVFPESLSFPKLCFPVCEPVVGCFCEGFGAVTVYIHLAGFDSAWSAWSRFTAAIYYCRGALSTPREC